MYKFIITIEQYRDSIDSDKSLADKITIGQTHFHMVTHGIKSSEIQTRVEESTGTRHDKKIDVSFFKRSLVGPNKNRRRISFTWPRYNRPNFQNDVVLRWSLASGSFGSNLYKGAPAPSVLFGLVSNEKIRPNGVWYPINRRCRAH